MKIFLVLFAVILLFPLNSFAQSEIPDWIRNNAKWWSDSQISDKDFARGIEHLIEKEVIMIPLFPQIDSDSQEQIPDWIKNNAKWWSQGLLSDDEFLKGIQYLTSTGIIHIQQNSVACLGNNLCITAPVERIVDGDTIYIKDYKIRLSLTNTPETYEVGFEEATDFTKKLCPVGSIIIVDQDDKQPYDVYGRLLGKVYCNGKVLNSELLINNHANILTRYCSTSEFSSESWALQYGCGKQEKWTQESKTTQSKENCNASYPDVCIPSPPPDLDCKDAPFKNFRVIPPDPHRFDGDKDGIGCES